MVDRDNMFEKNILPFSAANYIAFPDRYSITYDLVNFYAGIGSRELFRRIAAILT